MRSHWSNRYHYRKIELIRKERNSFLICYACYFKNKVVVMYSWMVLLLLHIINKNGSVPLLTEVIFKFFKNGLPYPSLR